MSYTTTNLLASINVRSFVPTDQATFTPAEILALADEETMTLIVPELMSVREEYFVTHKDDAITANQGAYDIPPRAIALAVREVKFVDSSGAENDIPRIDPELVETTNSGTPEAFYVKGNQIIVYPTPSATQETLRVYFFLRPSALVITSAAGLISAINTVTNTVTVSSIPVTWATGNVFDLIRQDGGQECVAIDQTSTSVSGANISFASLPSTLRVGDYVALAGESPLVQLPPEYRPVLAQAVTRTMIGGMRLPGAADAEKKLESMQTKVMKLTSPRVQGEPVKIKPPRW